MPFAQHERLPPPRLRSGCSRRTIMANRLPGRSLPSVAERAYPLPAPGSVLTGTPRSEPYILPPHDLARSRPQRLRRCIPNRHNGPAQKIFAGIDNEGAVVAFDHVRAGIVNGSHQAHRKPCPQSAYDGAMVKRIWHQTGGQARCRNRGAPWSGHLPRIFTGTPVNSLPSAERACIRVACNLLVIPMEQQRLVPGATGG
jgi:hypothetical protein